VWFPITDPQGLGDALPVGINTPSPGNGRFIGDRFPEKSVMRSRSRFVKIRAIRCCKKKSLGTFFVLVIDILRMIFSIPISIVIQGGHCLLRTSTITKVPRRDGGLRAASAARVAAAFTDL